MKDRKAFENHELWTLVEELKNDDRISDVPVDTRQYLRYLLEQLSKRKKTTNAYFVRRSSLDELRGQLGNIRNQIPRNVSAIDGAIDECMGIIASEWPANNGRQIADIAEGVRDEFFTATEEKIEQARESADKVEELSRQFEEKKAEFDNEIESLKSSFEEAVKASKADLDGRRDELGGSV